MSSRVRLVKKNSLEGVPFSFKDEYARLMDELADRFDKFSYGRFGTSFLQKVSEISDNLSANDADHEYNMGLLRDTIGLLDNPDVKKDVRIGIRFAQIYDKYIVNADSPLDSSKNISNGSQNGNGKEFTSNPLMCLRELTELNIDFFEPGEFNATNGGKNEPIHKINSVFDKYEVLREIILSLDFTLMSNEVVSKAVKGSVKELFNAISSTDDTNRSITLANRIDKLTTPLKQAQNEVYDVELEISDLTMSPRTDGVDYAKKLESLNEKKIAKVRKRVEIVSEFKNSDEYELFKDALKQLDDYISTSLFGKLTGIINDLNKYNIKFALRKDIARRAVDFGLPLDNILDRGASKVTDLDDLLNLKLKADNLISDYKQRILSLIKDRVKEERNIDAQRFESYGQITALDFFLRRHRSGLGNNHSRISGEGTGFVPVQCLFYDQEIKLFEQLLFDVKLLNRAVCEKDFAPRAVKHFRELAGGLDNYLDDNWLRTASRIVPGFKKLVNTLLTRVNPDAEPISKEDKVLIETYVPECETVINELKEILNSPDKVPLEEKLKTNPNNDLRALKNVLKESWADDTELRLFAELVPDYKDMIKRLLNYSILGSTNYGCETVKIVRENINDKLESFKLIDNVKNKFLVIGEKLNDIDPMLSRKLMAIEDLTKISVFNDELTKWFNENRVIWYQIDQSRSLETENYNKLEELKVMIGGFQELIDNAPEVCTLMSKLTYLPLKE